MSVPHKLWWRGWHGGARFLRVACLVGQEYMRPSENPKTDFQTAWTVVCRPYAASTSAPPR
ncbi:hypothetical protein [Kingella potus]|uniref:hypothetical protein n=1 Tax=Kingella potus TaxID=265175 RepID=UPI001FD4E676|nr:hypothetical protein [Kingella potus]UOP01441.1 hypothetical protein LVJ84_04330 [Kingella potus]